MFGGKRVDLTLLVDGSSVGLPGVLALGAGIGIVAGMFGVGGGFLLVPALHVVLGVSLPQAVGAALCQTIATSLGSLLRYRRMGHAEVRFDVLALGGSFLGVDAGARLLGILEAFAPVSIGTRSFLPVQLVLTTVYAGLFVTIAALLLWKPVPGPGGPNSPGPLAHIRVPPLVDFPTTETRQVSGPLVGFIGFVNGALAGLIGIGGGICLVPILLYGFGFDMKKAAGTGVLVVLAVALWGTLQHARLGNVHLGLATTLMIGSALAAQLGATLTRSLPAGVLRRALAVTLLLAVLALVWKLVR